MHVTVDKDGRPDFDMLLACVHYILSFKDAQLILQQKFRHILVDEFQDTNVMQVLTSLYFCHFSVLFFVFLFFPYCLFLFLTALYFPLLCVVFS